MKKTHGRYKTTKRNQSPLFGSVSILQGTTWIVASVGMTFPRRRNKPHEDQREEIINYGKEKQA
jgi:hypothetical protein